MEILSLPLLTAILSVVGKIVCFSSLTEVSTGPVALGKGWRVLVEEVLP